MTTKKIFKVRWGEVAVALMTCVAFAAFAWFFVDGLSRG